MSLKIIFFFSFLHSFLILLLANTHMLVSSPSLWERPCFKLKWYCLFSILFYSPLMGHPVDLSFTPLLLYNCQTRKKKNKMSYHQMNTNLDSSPVGRLRRHHFLAWFVFLNRWFASIKSLLRGPQRSLKRFMNALEMRLRVPEMSSRRRWNNSRELGLPSSCIQGGSRGNSWRQATWEIISDGRSFIYGVGEIWRTWDRRKIVSTLSACHLMFP